MYCTRVLCDAYQPNQELVLQWEENDNNYGTFGKMQLYFSWRFHFVFFKLWLIAAPRYSWARTPTSTSSAICSAISTKTSIVRYNHLKSYKNNFLTYLFMLRNKRDTVLVSYFSIFHITYGIFIIFLDHSITLVKEFAYAEITYFIFKLRNISRAYLVCFKGRESWDLTLHFFPKLAHPGPGGLKTWRLMDLNHEKNRVKHDFAVSPMCLIPWWQWYCEKIGSKISWHCRFSKHRKIVRKHKKNIYQLVYFIKALDFLSFFYDTWSLVKDKENLNTVRHRK